MRLATYNVEWFNALFGDDNTLLDDHQWSGRRDVTRAQQIDALGTVFRAMDADAVLVVEAPDHHGARDTVAALETFAARFDLRTTTAVHGFKSGTQQEIALLFDPAAFSARHDPRGSASAKAPDPRFDLSFSKDVDVDDRPETHVFSKPPLELLLTTSGGRDLRLIGVHAKSKAPHGARNPTDAVRIAIENRRKQLAQCLWLRRRVESHLDAGETVIVAGDLNDGPGLDEYEKLFGQSGVEIVLGLQDLPERQLHDPHARARLDPRKGWSPSTARFFNRQQGTYLNALLDFIMISPDLMSDPPPRWRIMHPFDDPDCFADEGLARALLTASDHFPVTLDIDL